MPVYGTKAKLFLPISLFVIYVLAGDIAQLARASALQAEGQGFKSPYLQEEEIFEIEIEKDRKALARS